MSSGKRSGEVGCKLNGFFAVVSDMHPNKHVGKTHDPKAYLTIADRYLGLAPENWSMSYERFP